MDKVVPIHSQKEYKNNNGIIRWPRREGWPLGGLKKSVFESSSSFPVSQMPPMFDDVKVLLVSEMDAAQLHLGRSLS